MKKFHITIADNETGEILTDEQTDCIIGAYSREKEETSITYIRGNDITIAATIMAVKDAIKNIYTKIPGAKLLEMIALTKQNKEKENIENE